MFAHGEGEKRSEGQQYKTSLCKNWESSGTVKKLPVFRESYFQILFIVPVGGPVQVGSW